MNTSCRFTRWILTAGLLLITAGAQAFQAPPGPELANFDGRTAGADAAAATEHRPAISALRARLPEARVDFDERTGAPKWIVAGRGFLSGPDAQGRGIGPAAARAVGAGEDHRATRAFLKEHQALFGFGPELLSKARLKQDSVTSHNGLRTAIWEQELDGIAVFEGLLISHTTASNELVNLSSGFVPDPAQAAGKGTPNRAAQLKKPSISAARAVALAVRNLKETVDEADVTAVEAQSEGAHQRQHFKAPPLNGEADTKLVWLPMSQQSLRLCWEVVLTSRARGEMFRVLIDVQTGEAVLRHRLTEYLSDASYRVFTSDSPSPFSPCGPTPSTNQPAIISRTLVTWSALDTNASPAGWINDGGNETLGNNVDAHTDRDNNNLPDLPRPQGSPFRTFDFALDLTQAPSTYTNAAIADLFYMCNWTHDRLYALGFTEAGRNFQSNNFARGGLGNDALQADAQDGGGFNNANMSTPSDGSPPRMQMYVFDGPTPDRDGDFDHEIVIHEYVHGLSNRRVGGGVGLSALQSRGMGEGWSDWYGMALLSEPGDNVNGNYAAGAYATYQFAGLLTNYYFGIRRYPYSTDMTKNPLTFRDIDPAQATLHPGIPRSPIIGSTADEVHNSGEVWCVTLWEARAELINKHGHTTGNELILRLVTDGMNLSPSNPNFLQARDAILQADVAYTGGANLAELWRAFAKRGMGSSASSPSSSTTAGLVESFDLPDDLTVTPAAGLLASGPLGGPYTPASQTYTLNNSSTNTVVWSAAKSAAWLDISATSGTITPGGPAATVVVSLNASANVLPQGVYTDTVRFTNHSTGVVQTRPVTLNAGRVDYFTELFDTPFDLDFQSVTFTPNGSADFYGACREAVTNFFTDPAGGIVVTTSDDTFTQVTLTGTNTVAVYSNRSGIFFIGSNGYLTMGSGDSTLSGSLSSHFSRVRVAALMMDLLPSTGRITYLQLSNRVAVTFLNVPVYGTSNTNSFQFEMFYDGTLRVTWLRIDAVTGLAGLSRGLGIPVDFLESDLSGYNSCGLSLAVVVPTNATEGDGTLSGQGEVRLLSPLATNLTVTLTSSDLSEVTVPADVTVLAGETNATFDVTIEEDALLDGTQTATVSAAATGFVSLNDTIAVADNETATLTLSLPASVTEGAAPVQGTVSASAAPDANITVSLISSDTTEIIVPSSVQIPSGQTSAVFNITIVNDTQIDGDQSATVTAHVANWTDGLGDIVVHDNEPTNLVVTLPVSAREGNGVLAGAGNVRIGGTLPTNLVVALLSSDTTELDVPPTTTIPAGQTNAAFNLTIVDDADIDSSQSVTVTASATGFSNGSTNMTITDDESPLEPFSPSPAHLATNVIQTSDLAWQSGALPGEVITNEVYFSTSPLPGPGAPEELAGITTNTSWPLPTLAPQTTFYWRVVARKAGVTPGPAWQFTTRGVDHFVWGTIPSTQYVSQPFPVTVTAKDAFETTVSNFTSTVAISGSSGGGLTTNTLLPSPVHIGSSSGIYTLAYAFTPSTNLTVTHVRSYSGTKVSIWSDTGTLLASQNVGGTPATWTDTALASPLLLTGGTTYRVSFYTAGGIYYYRSDRPATFPNGTIVSGYYYTTTDAFPSTFFNGDLDIFLCDLRYTVSSSQDIPITPAVSGSFANGAWSGDVSALAPTTSLMLRAADGSGHVGNSSPFVVALQNDIAVSVTDSPDPVSTGGNVTYSITVTNIGPANANNVVVTNVLPLPSANIFVTTSQGASTTASNLVVCELLTLGANDFATVTIVAALTNAGTFTNRTSVTRSDTDSYPANNSAVAVTTVANPSVTISDRSVGEGNVGTVTAAFTVTISPAPALAASVNFATSSSAAVAPGDFIGINGTLTFAPGETNKTLLVSIVGDALYEANEIFYVYLSAATNATIADNQGIGTILNDDPIPMLSISDVILTEGNTGTSNAMFTVTLSTVSGLGTTFSYATVNSSATGVSDFVTKSGSITLPAGSTTTNIAVTVNGDLTIETDEVFYVDMSAAVNAILLKREGYGLIVNDDGLPGDLDHFTWDAIASPQSAGLPFGVTINALDAFNNPAVNFNGAAFLNAATLPATTNILGTGTTALSFPIYTGGTAERTQVIYPANELGGAGRIHALAIDVSDVPGILLSNWVIRIKPTALTNYTSFLWENTNWTTVFQTNLSVTATGWVTFPLTTPFDYDGTNSLMVDFSFFNSTTFGAGNCRSTLRSTTRTIYYYTSSFGNPLTWSGTSPSPFTTTYTPNLRLLRGGDSVPIAPALTGPFVNATWSGDLTAFAPATNLILRADDGNSHGGASGPFNVVLQNDVSLQMSDAPDPVGIGGNVTYSINVTNIGPAAATGVLVSNQLPATASLVSVVSSQGSRVTNGSLVVCDLGFMPPNSWATLTIVALPTAPGSITNVATVTRAEPDTLPLNNTASATTLVQLPVLNISSVSVIEGNASTTPATLNVSLTPPPATDVSVSFATADGTAFAGSDYFATNGVMNFAIGQTNQTVTIQVFGDTTGEANETFSVILSAPTNATLGVASGTGTILTDDVPPFVYLRATVGSPWGSTANETAMHRAFGTNNWQDLRFETATPAALFTGVNHFIYMDGSDNGALELQTFLTANQTLIQNWVAAGGRLFINSAPNEGSGMSFGFGVTLLYSDFTSTAVATAPQHPIFAGPQTPVGLTWTGGSFGHATVSGTNLTALITNSTTGRILLGEQSFGSGLVLFGGMTTDNFHNPQPGASNLRANILAYVENFTICSNCPPTIITQPASQTVAFGGSATFNVQASGSAPMSYQWRKQGVPVVGATAANLSFVNAQLTGAGNYDVVVTNNYGAVTSVVAVLTVTTGLPVLINFDEISAPCGFIETVRLTNRYAALGALFAGPGGLDGGAILGECGGFGVTGHSSPNFLAFNPSVPMSDGGLPRGPETIIFQGLVSSVQLKIGSGQSGIGTLLAYNTNNVLLASNSVTMSSAMQMVQASASGIARIVISSTSSYWVVDDISFIPMLPATGNPALVFQSVELQNGLVKLTVGTVDASPITPQRASNVWVYASTDITLPLANWTALTIAPVLTNGVLTLEGINTENPPVRYFRAIEGAWTMQPLRLRTTAFTGGTFGFEAGNEDGSPLTPMRAARMHIYSTTNLTLPFGAWEQLNSTPLLSNGVLQVNGLSQTNGPARFFRMVEIP